MSIGKHISLEEARKQKALEPHVIDQVVDALKEKPHA